MSIACNGPRQRIDPGAGRIMALSAKPWMARSCTEGSTLLRRFCYCGIAPWLGRAAALSWLERAPWLMSVGFRFLDVVPDHSRLEGAVYRRRGVIGGAVFDGLAVDIKIDQILRPKDLLR